jgi:hypothetical protein
MPPSSPRRLLVPTVALLLMLAMVAAGPIRQFAHYHDFADQRTLLGFINGADVLSNFGFFFAGAWGLVLAARADGARDAARPAYVLFAVSIALTAYGSGWYHLAPDDARLLWDRLPIALACASLLGLAFADAVPGYRWHLPLLAALVTFGVSGVLWWRLTGDLRPYLLIQAAPLILAPLLQWQAGVAAARRRAFGLAIGLYVLAKLCELADQAILDALQVVGGHTLKHLLATAAAVVLLRDFAPRPT